MVILRTANTFRMQRTQHASNATHLYSGSHALALRSAAAASVRAALTMLHPVPTAFGGAGVAHVGAQRTQGGSPFAVSRHECGGCSAELRAVDIKRNAARHRPHIGFLQAGR
jgi:hypothetical protein